MPRGQLEIWNEAMAEHLGVGRISGINDTSPSAEQCRLHYDSCVLTLLEAHWWSWARTRKTLTEATTNDRSDDWAYKYNMPNNIAAIRWVNDPEIAHANITLNRSPDAARETTLDHIYTDVSSAVMEYTRLETTSVVWSSRFIDALKALLAVRACKPLTENSRLYRDVMDLSELYLERAIAHDEANSEHMEFNPLPTWLEGRGIS